MTAPIGQIWSPCRSRPITPPKTNIFESFAENITASASKATNNFGLAVGFRFSHPCCLCRGAHNQRNVSPILQNSPNSQEQSSCNQKEGSNYLLPF